MAVSQGNIEMIEDFLLEEIEARNENTFMYQLHDENSFCQDRFDLLLEKVSEFCEVAQKTDRKTMIAKGLIMLFEYTLFLFYCNVEPSDHYKIRNYDKVLSAEMISDYYLDMRYLSDKIIQSLSS
jgi:hypothetical protein